MNKSILSIGKEALYSGNMWIVIDFNCAHLLLPWVCYLVPLIVVDHQDAGSIPLGVMRVKMKDGLAWGQC